MIKLKEVVEEKLKEILIKPTPKNVWDLSEDDRHYTITDTPNDRELRSIGNTFLTEEAQFALERRKIEAILLKYGRRSFKYTEPNYYFTYDHEYKNLRFDLKFLIQCQGAIYFDTEELCEQAINEAGEENIKKYLFGVDEDD